MLMMAALRAASLLDRDEAMVSFQAIYHRLKRPGVETGLLQVLEDRYGSGDIFPPSRAELVEKFRQSVTLPELGAMIGIIGRLAATLRDLCQSPLAFHADMLAEYRDFAKNAIRK